jgi:DNA-binding transcriptional MerR regulator
MSDDATIAAFTEEQVERLTGLTASRLRYWDRTKFFVPSYADENRRTAYSRIYSFKDVAALRTISVLRRQHNVPLQYLRKVGAELRQLADDGWIKFSLYVLGKTVIFHDPETGQPREIIGHQYVVPSVPLAVVFSDTKRDVADLAKRPNSAIGQIKKNRYINHNTAVIAGTRIPTSAIKRFKDAGYSVEEIIREYPDLTPRDVEAALAHEARDAA